MKEYAIMFTIISVTFTAAYFLARFIEHCGSIDALGVMKC